MTYRQLPVIAVLSFAAMPSLAGDNVGAYLDSSSSTLGQNAPTVLALLKVELARYKMTVVEDPEAGMVFPGPEAAAGKGMVRVYVLTVLPLGGKLVVGLAERAGPRLEVAFSERMTATNVEEMDTVIPRLVEAVVEHKPVPESATVETVTDREGKEWKHRFGVFLWGVGIPCGTSLWSGAAFSYGGALRFAYEMESARIDLIMLGQFNGSPERLAHGNFAIEGAYLFMKRNISPYVGGGMGYSITHINGSHNLHDTSQGVVFNVGGGVEFFRLYKTRLMFDVKVGFPTFALENEGTKRWVPVLTTMLSFLW